MRSRTFREGSVGLLLLLGLGMFGIVILWLNRVTAARNSYKAIVEFANAGGMQQGALVRYRGVEVGRISGIRPGPNNVDVQIEIVNANLIIPSDVKVEANQTGLISENVIDITPRSQFPLGNVAKPLDKNCNPQLIVCNGSRLKGQIGISTDELIRATTQLTTVYSNPEFYSNVNKAVENTALAAANVAELTRNFNILSKSLQQQVNSLSTTTRTVQQSATLLTASTTRTLNQISRTANQFGGTAGEFGGTAKEIRLTVNQVNKLVNNLDTLLTNNRSSLVAALDNLSATSTQLRQTVSSLSPTVNRVTQGQLLQNLETLSVNAAQASANLRDVSNALNNPNNVLVLQQTLDSARVTFENTQKITSDLDELTGDPAFRQNLRQLVNGLSSLVSSTQQMQQQVEVASTINSVKAAIHDINAATSPKSTNPLHPKFDISSTVDKSTDKRSLPTSVILTSPTSKTDGQQIVFSQVLPTSVTISTQEPQPVTTSINLPSSQENLLKQLRQHREEREKGE
ncbi:MlaD family protein [Scytonema sp. NUACC21]